MLDLDSMRSMQVLDYADDTTVLSCNFGPFGQYVFAVDISNRRPSSNPGDGLHPRVRLCIPVRSPNKLFVRHNSHFLVMGSHSATGSHGHHEWLLQVFNLDTSEAVNVEPLQLQEFYGSEIGSTVCFTIHDGRFYAVTNQTSFESEEVDWTSYYHVVEFRLEDPYPELEINGIWRRQHLEGPINDAWTDLGFQIDQYTGELLLVECRKEWMNGGSRAIRTYYTQPMSRAKRKNPKEGLRHPPTGDRLINTLDEHSNSRYEEPEVRIERYVHAEFPPMDGGDTKEYIRAKTKWNGYDFNAQSFVDLVTDDFIPPGGWRAQQRIRLRVVSRQEFSPLVRDRYSTSSTALVVRPCVVDRGGEEIEDGERAFSQSQVRLWPPDNAHQELYDILCPDGRAGDVKAVLGDEGIIYMAGPVLPGSRERALIFICFDPTFGFVGMKHLDGTKAVGKRDMKRRGDELDQKDSVEVGGEDILQGRKSVPERTKRLKTEVDEDADLPTTSSYPESMVMDEEPSACLTVPVRRDVTALALGFDPIPLLMVSAEAPGSASGQLPAAELMRAQTDAKDPPKGPAAPGAPEDKSERRRKGKGKAEGKAPASDTLSTWRELAAYSRIGEGFWLR